jgi:hypothetical protein
VTRMPLLRRARWIAARRPPTPPCLTKVPLVRWDEGTRYVNCNHWVSRKTIAAETGLLLHLKLLNDFHTRAVQEAARGEYYDGAAEYRRYAAILAANPDLTLMYDASTRFESSDQLVRMGLMTDTGAWAAARSAERRSDRRE